MDQRRGAVHPSALPPHTDQLADPVDTLRGKCALAGKVTHLPVAGILCTTRPPGDGGLWPSDRAAVAAKLCFD